MSDRLAISSAFSILMMASYVLLGGDAAQVRLERLDAPVVQFAAPGGLSQAAVLLSR